MAGTTKPSGAGQKSQFRPSKGIPGKGGPLALLEQGPFHWSPQDSNRLMVGIHFGFRDLKSQGKQDVDAWETSSLTHWTPSRGSPRPFRQTSKIRSRRGPAPVREENRKGKPQKKLTPRHSDFCQSEPSRLSWTAPRPRLTRVRSVPGIAFQPALPRPSLSPEQDSVVHTVPTGRRENHVHVLKV